MSRHAHDLDALIRSARAERPANRWEKQQTLFRRFGLGGGAALLVTRLAQAFDPLVRAPRLTLGVVGLAAATTVAGLVFSSTPNRVESDHREEVVAPHAVSPAPIAVEQPSAPAEPPIPTMSVTALPAVPQRVQAPPPTARSSSGATPHEEEEDDLAKEAASLSRIRVRLAAGDFSSALAGVREHRAAFRRGLLEQEVSVVELEAHQGLGNDATACSLGRAFLEAHPSSAHRKRVMNLMRSCNP